MNVMLPTVEPAQRTLAPPRPALDRPSDVPECLIIPLIFHRN
jgi:hypothetical protein